MKHEITGKIYHEETLDLDEFSDTYLELDFKGKFNDAPDGKYKLLIIKVEDTDG